MIALALGFVDIYSTLGSTQSFLRFLLDQFCNGESIISQWLPVVFPVLLRGEREPPSD